MNKERKRSGYHIEFINPRQTKKYKFYFFDYLYYMGEIYHENRWGEKSWRMSGPGVLIWYWWLILYPFLSIGLRYIENTDIELAILCVWGMFPILFCFLRYHNPFIFSKNLTKIGFPFGAVTDIMFLDDC